MAYQTPGSFELSPSTKRRIDTPPRRRAKRPATADTPLQVADAQAKRAALAAAPCVDRVMCAFAYGANWTLTDGDGKQLATGSAGQDRGVRRTLSIAIGKAVALAALSATDDSVCRLVVQIQEFGFRYANLVGTADDEGKGGKVRSLALKALKMRVLLTVKYVDSVPGVAQAVPVTEARAPLPVTADAPDLEGYTDRLVQALRACASHLSIDEVARYQITGRITHAERELIHSLAGGLVGAGAHAAVAQPEALPAEAMPEDYIDDLIQALRACAAHLSIDAAAKYQIARRIGQPARELIHSLAAEPAMADVQDGLYDRPHTLPSDEDAALGESAACWQREVDARLERGELPF
ncbi:MAG TPA: hypothetical protein VFQ95_08025 [Rhodanobacteraceae bacterium]|nr:hypothetical protein [Rhodanobacteraceae bacterium]